MLSLRGAHAAPDREPRTNDMKKHLKMIAGAALGATLLVGCPAPDGAGDT